MRVSDNGRKESCMLNNDKDDSSVSCEPVTRRHESVRCDPVTRTTGVLVVVTMKTMALVVN